MTEHEWEACQYPDLMLEDLVGTMSREQLVDFVRRRWERIAPYLPPAPHEQTLVEEFAQFAPRQSDFDAATYAAEAVLKAARWAPDLHAEQHAQAELLRRLVGNPFHRSSGVPRS